MKKVINFTLENDGVENWFEDPIPARKIIPEWYKSQDNYTNGIKIMQENGNFNTTIKACMPIFDIMTAGYIITLPADIYVQVDKTLDIPKLSWSINNFIPVQDHKIEQFNKYNVPQEYYQHGFKFMNKWVANTPKGYSSLFITPSLRDDLPFYCLPAIVDTDKHPAAVNFPFFLRKDFEGTIYKGTPIIQIIPFKRESWDINVLNKTNKNNLINRKKAEGTIENRYKKYFRSVKEW